MSKQKTLFLAAMCGMSMTLLSTSATEARSARTSYIVEGPNTESVAKAVRTVGGRITHELPIIDGVAALLTRSEVDLLRKQNGITLFTDGTVTNQTVHNPWGYYAYTVGNAPIDPYARTMAGVEDAAAQGFDGTGVTIAVLDSGIWSQDPNVSAMSMFGSRLKALYDTTIGGQLAWYGWQAADQYGHGSHITTVMTSPDTSVTGRPLGIAPGASLVEVKAFDATGNGSYSNVISGLGWILANRNSYNIRVLNLSFGAAPQSYYWNDPIDQAVMKLWWSWRPPATSDPRPKRSQYRVTRLM
jgi:serine protease AprX